MTSSKVLSISFIALCVLAATIAADTTSPITLAPTKPVMPTLGPTKPVMPTLGPTKPVMPTLGPTQPITTATTTKKSCDANRSCKSCLEASTECYWCTIGVGKTIAIPEMPGKCVPDYRECEADNPFGNLKELFELSLNLVDYIPVMDEAFLTFCTDIETPAVTTDSGDCKTCIGNKGHWCDVDIHLPLLGSYRGGLCLLDTAETEKHCDHHKHMWGGFSYDFTLQSELSQCGRSYRRLEALESRWGVGAWH